MAIHTESHPLDPKGIRAVAQYTHCLSMRHITVDRIHGEDARDIAQG